MIEKEFLTYEEAMEYLGCKRSTLYNLITDLDIPTKKFKRDKHRYLALGDVKRLKQIRDKPWLAGEEGKHRKRLPRAQRGAYRPQTMMRTRQALT